MKSQTSVVQVSLSLSLSLSLSKKESMGKGWVDGSLIDGSQKITTQILTFSCGSPPPQKKALILKC